jgi:hypothetical protein
MNTFEVFWASVALIVLFIVCGGIAGIFIAIRKIANYRLAIVKTIKGIMPHRTSA